jgi:hypothetical protein
MMDKYPTADRKELFRLLVERARVDDEYRIDELHDESGPRKSPIGRGADVLRGVRGCDVRGGCYATDLDR